MDLNQILESRLFPVVLVVGILMLVLLVGGPAYKDKITDEVIETLQKDYSPGPYAPGFDPDKVNPNFWTGNTQFVVRSELESNPQINIEEWNRSWEKARH